MYGSLAVSAEEHREFVTLVTRCVRALELVGAKYFPMLITFRTYRKFSMIH